MTRHALAVLALTGTVALSAPARADMFPSPDGIWMPAGVTLGFAALEDEPDTFVLGGELSLVGFATTESGPIAWFWVGAVADATWEFDRESLRHRAGAEAGMYFFGLELAYLGELHDGTYRPGIEMRTTGNLPFFSIYVGYGHLFGGGTAANMAELGLSLKFPIPLVVPDGPDFW